MDSRATELPAPESLPEIKELPDPFLKPDGKRVATPAEWLAQRKYLKRLVQETKYGLLPGTSDLTVTLRESGQWTTTGGVRRCAAEIVLERRMDAGSPAVQAKLPIQTILPETGNGPWPLWIHGYVQARENPSLDQMKAIGAMFVFVEQGKSLAAFRSLYPEYRDTGTLIINAWGCMRALDGAINRPEVDQQRVVVQGFSGMGMASLVAGALDERFTVTITGGSNVGGVQPSRQYAQSGPGQSPLPRKKAQDAPAPPPGRYREYDLLIRVPANWSYWNSYAPRYKEFYGKEQHLPMDAHTVVALCAPRTVLICEGLGDRFGYCAATEQTFMAAKEVYRFLGAADNLCLVNHPGGHMPHWPSIMEFAGWRLTDGPKPRDYSQLVWPGMDRLFSWSAPQAGGQQSNDRKQP